MSVTPLFWLLLHTQNSGTAAAASSNILQTQTRSGQGLPAVIRNIFKIKGLSRTQDAGFYRQY